MSYNPGLSTVAIKQYSSEFLLQAQQIDRKFAGKTIEIYDLTGDDYTVKFAKQWAMKPRTAYHSTQPQQIPEYRKPVIPRLEFAANVPSDIFEQTKVNASEMRVQARQAVVALNRMQDQVIIDSLDTDSGSMTEVEQTSNLTVDGLINVSKEFGTKNVENSQRIIVAHESQKASLLKQTKASSSDYASVKALVRGEINTFMGFTFVWFGDMEEGGLTKTTGVRKCYAFHYNGIAAGWWMRPSVDVTYKAEAFSHLVLPRVICGSKVIDTDRTILISCTEA